MEALAALGLAGNIIQVVSFCHETVSLSTKIYRKGSSDPELAQDVSQIKKLAEQLNIAISNSAEVMKTASPTRAELMAIARDCSSAAEELELELNQASRSKAGAFGKAVKFMLRKSKLESLEQRLMRHQKTLQSRLLFEIWYVKDLEFLLMSHADLGLNKTLLLSNSTIRSIL
jgi:hypothetical protein